MTRSSLVERRHTHWCIKNKEVLPWEVIKLTADDAEQLFEDVRNRRSSKFGIRKISKLDLSERWPFPHHLTPRWFQNGSVPNVTIAEYAALFGNRCNGIVNTLLHGGAPIAVDDCDCQEQVKSFLEHSNAYFTGWVFQHVTRMAFHLDHTSGSTCLECKREVQSNTGDMRCDMLHIWPTCEHHFCGHCVWIHVCKNPLSFKCPYCNLKQPDDPDIGVPSKCGSRELFISLPDQKLPNEKKKDSRCMSISKLSVAYPGSYKSKRMDKFMEASLKGHLWRMKGLLSIGVDVDIPNEYGQTALMIACWYGHSDCVQFLLSYGASITILDNTGRSAADIVQINHPTMGILHSAFERHYGKVKQGKLKVLIDDQVDHPGAGSYILDDFVDEEWLLMLDQHVNTIPRIEQTGKNRLCSERSYLCDSIGTIIKTLNNATRMTDQIEFEFFPQMRFLIYGEPGMSLPPHIDLTRTNSEGLVSTHTFILYLDDCNQGGETALLESLSSTSDSSNVLVNPKRGRLLLFPHFCPHEGKETIAYPKILLRGEAYYSGFK